MFNSVKKELEGANLQNLISQITPEQAAHIRTTMVNELLIEKTFNPNNPFFLALKADKNGSFAIFKDELVAKISTLPDSHPAKKIVW